MCESCGVVIAEVKIARMQIAAIQITEIRIVRIKIANNLRTQIKPLCNGSVFEPLHRGLLCLFRFGFVLVFVLRFSLP